MGHTIHSYVNLQLPLTSTMSECRRDPEHSLEAETLECQSSYTARKRQHAAV